MEHWLVLTVSLQFLLLWGNSVSAQSCADEGITATVDIGFGSSTLNQPVDANNGSPLELDCEVTLDPGLSSDTPPSITSYVWTNNGEILSSYTGATLQIASVQSSDGGDYTCRAVTDLPCTTLESVITSILTEPVVTIEPSSDISVDVGARVELTCSAEGWPAPSTTWRKTGGDGTVEDISTNPVFVIDSVALSDAADYSCRVENGRGNAVQGITLTVLERTTDPPSTTTGTTKQDDNSGGNSGNTGMRPTEDGFYIAIAVSAVVCVIVTVFTIVAVILWCVSGRSSHGGAEANDNVEEETL